jgi:muramoyltetrapeptide carboxypeptidase
MHRRHFLKVIPAAAALAAAPFETAGKTVNTIIKPYRLKPGDTIGIIAPGSFITEKELNISADNIKKLGFNVYYSDRVLSKYGYLSGTDRERADDVNAMFSNSSVNGIICARGGYGCSRILPLLDYELIRNNPKVISGYSDITSLLYGIFSQTGLICFHGPVGISTFNDYSVDAFYRVMVNPVEHDQFFSKPEAVDKENYRIRTIVSGKGRGKLVGGNLSVVLSMLGTPYDISTEGKIVFLEEVGEEPYRIDRMLTQLIQAGKLDKAAGIIMGIFVDCEPGGKNTSITNSFSLMEILFEKLSPLKIPVIYGTSFGHVKNKLTLPLGIEAELDTEVQSLTLLESAVTG